ncbi:MAG: cobalt-precorrin hydrolase, partial [Pseudomonadota bacterium]|nr:cobalt-precorrin hydrolase [Pseudomonadota bacterium]
DHYRAVLWITHAVVTPEQWQQLHERLVVYRPPQEGAP